MSTLLIESTNRKGSCISTSVMVHCRNTNILSKTLGWDVLECEHDAEILKNKTYSNLVCVYASHYMPWKTYLPLIQKHQPQAKIWWLINDHDIEGNILIRKWLNANQGSGRFNVISNNTMSGFRQWILNLKIHGDIRLRDCIDRWFVLNLNALIYDPQPQVSKEWYDEHYDCVYWGSWRKWRIPYFKKYDHGKIFFSASPKHKHKIKSECPSYKLLPPLSWGKNSELHRTKCTFYIEDPHTHENFAFMANRFYESLSYGVPIYFDVSCRDTINKSGYKNPIIVNGPSDLFDASETWESESLRQYYEWGDVAAKEKADVINSLKNIMEGN